MNIKPLAFCLIFTLGLLLASGCDDDSPVDPDLPQAFSLHITVQDDAGQPVPGLTARLDVPIPAASPDGVAARRAATVFRFQIPERLRVQVRLFDLDDRLVRDLFGGVLETGQHQLTFNGLDDGGNHLFGTTVLRCEVQARDPETDELVHTESNYPVYYPAGDLDRAPVLGVTDAAGSVSVDDVTLFPGLRELPELVLVDSGAQELGVFTISNDVVIHLSDGVRSSRHVVSTEPGRNDVVLVRSEAPVVRDAFVSPDSPSRRFLKVDGPITPLDGFVLLQNYPNPFN